MLTRLLIIVTILPMKKTILISPGDITLGNLLTQFALSEGFNVVSLVEEEGPRKGTSPKAKRRGNEKEEDTKGKDDSEKTQSGASADILGFEVKYNWRSPLSAPQVRTEAVNRYGGIDEAILLYEMKGENKPLQDLSPSSMEEEIDRGIKGTYFLLRELVNLFQRKRKGVLTFVLYQARETLHSPLGSTVMGGIQGLVNALFTIYQNESFAMNGVDIHSVSTEEAADYVWKIQKEKAHHSQGKWFKMSDRSGFLQSFIQRGS